MTSFSFSVPAGTGHSTSFALVIFSGTCFAVPDTVTAAWLARAPFRTSHVAFSSAASGLPGVGQPASVTSSSSSDSSILSMAPGAMLAGGSVHRRRADAFPAHGSS